MTVLSPATFAILVAALLDLARTSILVYLRLALCDGGFLKGGRNYNSTLPVEASVARAQDRPPLDEGDIHTNNAKMLFLIGVLMGFYWGGWRSGDGRSAVALGDDAVI
jgi:hypothetical protein